MKHRVCATAPHHITALFKPYISESPRQTGSIGVGLVVEPRVKACIPGDLNPGDSPIAAVRRVVELLQVQGLSFNLNTPLPIGVGFATSAASAIVTVLTMGSSGELSYYKSLELAHKAEVLESTGLGDVLAISCGIGLTVRLKPGAPGIGSVDCRQLPPGISIIGLAVRSEHTRELVKHYIERGLHEKALPIIEKIVDSMSFELFSELILKFNLDHAILKGIIGDRGEELILKTPGLITAYGKKGVIMVIVEEDKLGDAISHLNMLSNTLNYKIYHLEPSRGGPELWVV